MQSLLIFFIGEHAQHRGLLTQPSTQNRPPNAYFVEAFNNGLCEPKLLTERKRPVQCHYALKNPPLGSFSPRKNSFARLELFFGNDLGAAAFRCGND